MYYDTDARREYASTPQTHPFIYTETQDITDSIHTREALRHIVDANGNNVGVRGSR